MAQKAGKLDLEKEKIGQLAHDDIDHLAPADPDEAPAVGGPLASDAAVEDSVEAAAGSSTSRPGDGTNPIRTDVTQVDDDDDPGSGPAFGAGAVDIDDASMLGSTAGADPQETPSVTALDDWESPVAHVDDDMPETDLSVSDDDAFLPMDGAPDESSQPFTSDADVD